MFATDHAPHPAATKANGFRDSANGIVGLETAIPVTYRVMVEEEGMPVDAWARAWHEMPASLFPRTLAPEIAALPQTAVEIGATRAVDISSFASLSRNCPYHGMEFSCWPKEVLK